MSAERPKSPRSEATQLTLVVTLNGRDSRELFVEPGLTIGRATSNPIPINDGSVAPIHARVLRDGRGGFEVVAESATTGLHEADGNREFQRIALVEGTKFRVGPATITCRAYPVRSQTTQSADVWGMPCPRCLKSLAACPNETSHCPDCELPLWYFTVPVGQDAIRAWFPRYIGPYEVLGFVGQGGMGTVLRGVHQRTGQLAAIKIPRIPPGETAEWLQRFETETHVLRSLDHPQIVRLQDAGRDQHLIWLAMDWIEGRTLAAVIEEIRQRRGRLGIKWIRDQLVQVSRGLAYLHQAGIIHRDLKPGNILIDISGKVYLTDMGLAKAVDGATVGTELTRTGSIMGSWHYMAPEQHQGGKITAAVDLYAFGVIWYELLTGQKPMGAFSLPSCHRDDLPSDWDRWVFACLAPDVLSRPSTSEVIQCLRKSERANSIKVLNDSETKDTAKDLLPGQPHYHNVQTTLLPSKTIAQQSQKHEGENVSQLWNVASWLGIIFLSYWFFGIGGLGAFFVIVFLCAWLFSEDPLLKAIKLDAENGDVDAMCKLGVMYADGEGVGQDAAKAVEWFRKAADAGNSNGMLGLGCMYKEGRGVARDDVLAVEWYREAANAGDSCGMYCLGRMYEEGEGVAQDDVQAVEWFREAADAGDTDAMARLGYMYDNGKGVGQDAAKAVEWFRKAADAGNPNGMLVLGWMYANGQGVAQDDAQAVEWTRKAADAGLPAAMCILGRAYANGQGVARHEAQSVFWFREAAKLGDEDALDELRKRGLKP